MGSKTTIDKAVYEKTFQNSGISLIHPSEDQEDSITKIIHQVMAGKETKKDAKTIQKIATKLKSQGAQAIIIGCTELSVFKEKLDLCVQSVDSTEILARSAVKYART